MVFNPADIELDTLYGRLQQLEDSVYNHVGNNVFSSQFPHPYQFSGFNLRDVKVKVISGGVINIDDLVLTRGYTPNKVIDVLVDTEGAAASDDLDTVTWSSISSEYGLENGQIIILRPVSTARVVTVKNGTGNITLSSDYPADLTTSTLTLLYIGTGWLELARGVRAQLRASPLITPLHAE